MDYKKDADADDLDAIKLMCQHHLYQDVKRSLPSYVVISSVDMLRPCQYRNKNQLNCLGGCVRSLTLPLELVCSLNVNLLWLDNYSFTCNHSVTIQECHNSGHL